MSNVRITYFLVIIQVVFVDNKFLSEKNESGSSTRVVNVSNSTRRNSDVFPENHFRYVLLCDGTNRSPCGNGNGTSTGTRNSRSTLDQVRWTEDVGRFSSAEAKQRAAPVKKSAHFDLVTDDREQEFTHFYPSKETENDQQDDEEAEEEEEEQDGEPDDGDDEYTFDLLETDDKPAKKKTHREEDLDDEDSDEEDEDDYEDDDDDGTPKLKHLFKHKLKMKDLMFLLLLAYKLKFVTLVPLFLKALILLVGTTSMAGFFFALFSAALGLQSTRQR